MKLEVLVYAIAQCFVAWAAVQEVTGSILASATYFRRMHCGGYLSITMADHYWNMR